MPVLRSCTEWRNRHGRRRVIRLYRSYQNMMGRIKGWNHDGTGLRRWKGMQCDFYSYAEFRSWALKNGYSRERCSLDRIDNDKGYMQDNLQWLSRAENSAKTHAGYRKDKWL